MTQYPQSAYGPRDRVPWLENSANGWGEQNCWPHGVPADLLATVKSADGTPFVVRKELAELVGVLFPISEVVFGYPLHNANGVGGWSGGYENRAIAGTSTASAHSRARAIDVKAQDNPQSWTFISTWPPDLIAIWERCYFYWGGRYLGARFDTMHLSYCGTPGQVAGHLAIARAYLAEHSKITAGGGAGVPKPTPVPIKPAPAPSGTYTVRQGDTLSGIAAAHGTTVAALVAANGIRNPDVITVGQVLRLSGSAPKPAPAPAPKPAVPADKRYRPLPGGWPFRPPDYVGDIAGDRYSHGGGARGDNPTVEWVSRALYALGYAPVAPDGKFEAANVQWLANWQRDYYRRHGLRLDYPGRCYGDDYRYLDAEWRAHG